MTYEGRQLLLGIGGGSAGSNSILEALRDIFHDPRLRIVRWRAPRPG